MPEGPIVGHTGPVRLRLPWGRLLPWRGRRLAVVAAVVAVAMLAGALTGLQIRAAQAQDRRDALAAEEAEARAAAEAEEQRRAEAQEWLDAFLAESDLTQAWAVAAQQAELALADADAAVAASEGKVSDDAVRIALVETTLRLRDMLTARPTVPSAEETAALAETTAALTAGTAAVVAAQAEWQAAQEAAAAAPRSSGFQARGWPHDGAAPDCGSPESYEPSRGGTFRTSVPGEDGDGSNGRMPRSAMTALGWCTDNLGNEQWLRTDAAEALVRLNEAFRAEFGENIAIDLSYRSYEDQVRAREIFGSLAARPGTSNHGTGRAFDTWEWAAYSFGSARYEWLVANGPTYGWVAPSWARQNGSNPEYWHFEYTG